MTKLKDLEMRTCLIWMVVIILIVGIPIMAIRVNKQMSPTRTEFEKSSNDLKTLDVDVQSNK
jgi:hypothetical protein